MITFLKLNSSFNLFHIFHFYFLAAVQSNPLHQLQGYSTNPPHQLQGCSNNPPHQLQGCSNNPPHQLQGCSNNPPHQLQGCSNNPPHLLQGCSTNPPHQFQSCSTKSINSKCKFWRNANKDKTSKRTLLVWSLRPTSSAVLASLWWTYTALSSSYPASQMETE